MKSVALSMTRTLATIYPPLELQPQFATKQEISVLKFRIMMVNQLLIACLDAIEKNPHFWVEIDMVDFKKYLTENKAVVFDMQDYFSGNSRTRAVLDNMKSNIQKIETALSHATAFNFDLARMEDRLNDTFHEVPKEVTNVSEFKDWLKGVANGH